MHIRTTVCKSIMCVTLTKPYGHRDTQEERICTPCNGNYKLMHTSIILNIKQCILYLWLGSTLLGE